jgi:hypothetical protein
LQFVSVMSHSVLFDVFDCRTQAARRPPRVTPEVLHVCQRNKTTAVRQQEARTT